VRPRPALIAAVLAAAAVGALLTGCSAVVDLDPAPHAGDPACTTVTARLPHTVEQLPRRETDARSTGAWGDPAAVLLRCGVTVPTASDLPCIESDAGYPWLVDDSKSPTLVFTSYGRSPAIAVVVDQTKLSPGAVLHDLEPVVALTAENGRKCLSGDDVPTPSPTPGPTP
jgi:hypothetical protein